MVSTSDLFPTRVGFKQRSQFLLVRFQVLLSVLSGIVSTPDSFLTKTSFLSQFCAHIQTFPDFSQQMLSDNYHIRDFNSDSNISRTHIKLENFTENELFVISTF